jgi:uncharacterized membrane protein
MANVHALLFEEMNGADNFYAALESMAEEGMVTIVDAVIAVRNIGKEVEVRQMTDKKTGRYAAGGGGVGFLAGMLLGGPILGLAAGAGIGAITARMKDEGLDDDFVKNIVDGIRPETSILFLMTEDGDPERINEALRPFKATLLTSNLPSDRQAELEELLKREE